MELQRLGVFLVRQGGFRLAFAQRLLGGLLGELLREEPGLACLALSSVGVGRQLLLGVRAGRGLVLWLEQLPLWAGSLRSGPSARGVVPLSVLSHGRRLGLPPRLPARPVSSLSLLVRLNRACLTRDHSRTHVVAAPLLLLPLSVLGLGLLRG